jgi:tetratricopeptide (TPR) repeat protein
MLDTLIQNELNLNSAVYVLAGDVALGQIEKNRQSADENSANSGNNNSNEKQSLQDNEELQNAVTQYRKALSLNPDNAKAANRLAKLMREQGEFEQAESLYTQAIEAQSMYSSSYRNRAVLRDLYMQKKALALSDYKSYVALLEFEQEQANSGASQLSESQLKTLTTNIRLAKRWVIDTERQVAALEKQKENS